MEIKNENLNIESNKFKLRQSQQWGLIILRIILGWYFLYEGLVKLLDPAWTAEGFLVNSRSIPFISDMFLWIASRPALMELVDFLNVWGLILIGLGLLVGFLARTAVYAAILLLFFYYIAYLPLDKFTYGIPREGSYLLFNKTFIELVTMVILALFPSTLNIGIWSLLKKIKIRKRFSFNKLKPKFKDVNAKAETPGSRRELLKQLAFLPFIGGFVWAFESNKKFLSRTGVDAITSGTIQLKKTELTELEGEMPQGTLGGSRPVSRLIMGCNLIGGWAHSRDLIYAPQLFKAYNSEKKVFETLILGERAGINTMNVCTQDQLVLINKYKKLFGSNLQTMLQTRIPSKEDPYSDIDKAIDNGVDIIQIFGAHGDKYAFEGEAEVLHKCIEYTQKQGYPVGLGAHDIHAFYEYDKVMGLEPDFYFKTMHHDRYWSVIPKEKRVPFGVSGGHKAWGETVHYHDNMWCLFPEETIDYVQKCKKPVVGYKVLAAGAIPAKEAFEYAFDNGADFICVGMFDFQVVEDANLTISAIGKAKNRNRPWYG